MALHQPLGSPSISSCLCCPLDPGTETLIVMSSEPFTGLFRKYLKFLNSTLLSLPCDFSSILFCLITYLHHLAVWGLSHHCDKRLEATDFTGTKASFGSWFQKVQFWSLCLIALGLWWLCITAGAYGRCKLFTWQQLQSRGYGERMQAVSICLSDLTSE